MNTSSIGTRLLTPATAELTDTGRPQAWRTQACRTVIMVGIHRRGMGGMASVVRGYEQAGLFDRVRCVYVTTHRDGNFWLKGWIAGKGWIEVALLLMTSAAPVLHIHVASRASFWRKAGICLMALICRRPYILHVHGSEFMIFHDDECSPGAQRFVRWLFGHAAMVIALSSQWRDYLRRVSPEANVVELPNGVMLPDLMRVDQTQSHERSIVSLGRLGRRKGSFDLVEAFARVAASFPQWKLICAGDGAIDEVRAAIARLGLQDRITCPGWLDEEGTKRALAAASIFALPSYAEGLPMALLEAMAWQLPAITSPVGGISQVVQHGVNGYLVAPGDIDGLAASLSRVMADEAERQRVGRAARITVESQFSQKVMISRLEDIYAQFGVDLRCDLH